MNVQEKIFEAQHFRRMALEAYGRTPIPTLELLRTLCEDDKERKVIDWVLTARKREAKAIIEPLDRLGDMYDKAALPVSAAPMALSTLLLSEQMLPPGIRPIALLTSLVLGAVVWSYCRYKCYSTQREYRIALTQLGKVE